MRKTKNNEKERAFEIIKNMLRTNIDMGVISDCTETPIEELLEIKKKYNL